jgi:hypothetical protein
MQSTRFLKIEDLPAKQAELFNEEWAIQGQKEAFLG